MLLPLLVSASETIPDGKSVLQFQAKTGVVTFNHSLHATLNTGECKSCHHTHKVSEPIQRCSDCHKKKKATKIEGYSDTAPKSSKAYHLKCKGCHKYTIKKLGKPAGPVKCNLCHIKSK